MNSHASNTTALPQAIEEALQHHRAGRFCDAESIYRHVLTVDPEYFDALHLLGVLVHQTGRNDEALDLIKRAVRKDTTQPSVFNNLGEVYRALGRFEDAERCYRQALVLKPDYAEAHNNLGNTLLGLRSPEKEECLRQAPELLESIFQTAMTHLEQRAFDAAIIQFRKLLTLVSAEPAVWYNLGRAYQLKGNSADAELCFQQALLLEPENPSIWFSLSSLYQDREAFAEAESCLRNAHAYASDSVDILVPEAYSNLGYALMDLGRLDEAEASFRHALELKPNFFAAHSNLLFVQSYSVGHDSACHLELARSYGRMAGKSVTAKFASWHCISQPGPLRVGLVSGDFINHPVGFFLETVLAHLNASRIELIAYATQRRCDDLTDRIKPFFSEWRQLDGLDDESAAHLIHNDRVHILIDLAGHTAHNRLPVFAWKPAPVQVSWLGYGSTTGVSEIDYILGNPYSTPAEEANHFTEAIWQLPETSLCFSLPNLDLEVAPLPALTNGFITFGCFNNLAKLNDEVLSLWARILKAVPASRLFLKNNQLGKSSVCKATIARFAACGISEDRLLLEGRSPRSEYLRAYNRVDIVLDPFPFPGGTTTAEGLWMGVPFITRQGDRFISHQGEMIARNTGLLSEWIARDDDEYVAKAIFFSSNPEYLAGLRTILRRHLQLSPLFDASRFARYLEKALWDMWDRFSEQYLR